MEMGNAWEPGARSLKLFRADTSNILYVFY